MAEYRCAKFTVRKELLWQKIYTTPPQIFTNRSHYSMVISEAITLDI